ncbi:hypothetical protein EC988_009580, partial [Linderina pennispora]
MPPAEEAPEQEIGPQGADAEGVSAPTLFVANLPEDLSVDVLAGLFQQYAGFRQVRQIEGKQGIAFVDYESARDAAAARDVLDGFRIAAD